MGAVKGEGLELGQGQGLRPGLSDRHAPNLPAEKKEK